MLGGMTADSIAMLAILAVAGVVAGVINTMAGGGSLLTLPLLVAAGLPASVANGTNRLAVVMQGVSAVATFHRRGVRDYGALRAIALPMSLGAVGGAWAATRMSDAWLRPLFGGFLILWAVVIAVRPGRFFEPPASPRSMGPLSWLAAAATGAYGGFAQAGVGFPLMALLISGLGYPVVRANALKVAVVLVFTLLVVPIFVWQGQVAWPQGVALACGSTLGGFLGSRWQIRSGAGAVRWVVIVMVVASAAFLLFG